MWGLWVHPLPPNLGEGFVLTGLKPFSVPDKITN